MNAEINVKRTDGCFNRIHFGVQKAKVYWHAFWNDLNTDFLCNYKNIKEEKKNFQQKVASTQKTVAICTFACYNK